MKPYRLYNADGVARPSPRRSASPPKDLTFTNIILYILMGVGRCFLIPVHVLMGPELRNRFRSQLLIFLRICVSTHKFVDETPTEPYPAMVP